MNETAQKILSYIKRLPETWDGQPLRQQALDNFDSDGVGTLSGFVNEKEFLIASFKWSQTKEDYSYWSDIDELIRNGIIQLLPEVEEKKEEKKEEFVWTDELVEEFICEKLAFEEIPIHSHIEQFKASKQRKPLFVTEDGVEVFDGDMVISVYSDYQSISLQWSKRLVKIEGAKYFSTEAAAREYVRLNKPMYSLNLISRAMKAYNFSEFQIEKIITELEKIKP